MIDRVPPYSQEAEVGVLGCILLDPKVGLENAVSALRMDCDPFYDVRHQDIFEAMRAMADERMVIEPFFLCQFLKDRQKLEQVGGAPYIAGLTNSVPSAASLEYYIEILNEKAFRRMAMQACTRLIGELYDSTEPIESLIDSVETRILGLKRNEFGGGNRAESFRRICQQLEDEFSGKEIPGLIKTGFPDIDKILGGLHPGDQIVISARPGLGKSTLAMNIAENVAVDAGFPVGYFSLEMPEDKLNRRSIASRAKMELSIFKRQVATNGDFTRLITVCGKLSKAAIEIDFTPGMSISQLRARARRMASKSEIKLLVVDMIQLVEGRSQVRREVVGEVSRGLKALAGDLRIPIISISSMNRDIERSENRRPRLSDLKESGDIESDADVVGFLWQPDPTAETDGMMPTEFYVAKNRNGETGEAKLLFFKRHSRFESVSRVDDGDGI